MEEITNDLAEFDPQVRLAVEGLIHLGHLSDTFEFAGHTFTLRTLKVHEELAAAQAIQPFNDTLKAPDAWMAAQVGLALTEVDGQDDFCPQAGPDTTAHARARFNYVTKNWYWPTVQFLFQCYTNLMDKQVAAIRAMRDLSPRSQPTFSDLADSFAPQDTLSEEMLAEIQGVRS